MKTRALVAAAACVFALAASAARAADAVPAAAPATAPATTKPTAPGATSSAGAPTIVETELGRGGEPAVQRTIIDDSRARIEELRVRGQLQKVTVEPKGRAPAYEILLGDGSHVVADDPGTSRGSAGKRVWNVLRF